MIDQERLARLKKRFEFDRWPVSEDSPPGESPSEIDIENLIPGWTLASSEAGDTEGLPPGVRLLRRSLWQAKEGDRDRVLALDIYECGSESAAKEFLLEQLDQFESPLMERLEGAELVGDVAFSHPGRYVALFARGRRVVVLKNAGSEPVPTLEIARQVDAYLDRGGPSR